LKQKWLSETGKWLLGITFYAVVIAVLILILKWGGSVALWLEPWVSLLSGLGLLIGLPICLILLISRRTRVYGGIGIYYISWPVGLSVWIGCVLYALSVSITWTVVGILMAGIGVVPISGIMALIRRDWSSLGGLVISVLIVFGLRALGLWIASTVTKSPGQN
jgi:hypothetical protein